MLRTTFESKSHRNAPVPNGQRGVVIDTCLKIVGTTWVELEKAIEAEDEREVHKLGERLRGHLVFAVVVCTATSGMTMLVAYEHNLEGRIPATILRLARCLGVFGIFSGAHNFYCLQKLFSSPSAVRDLLHSKLRVTCFCMAQTLTHISFWLAFLLTPSNFYLWYLALGDRPWGILTPMIIVPIINNTHRRIFNNQHPTLRHELPLKLPPAI